MSLYDKQIKIETLFETSTRFTNSNFGTSSSITYDNSGVTLHAGTDTSGRAAVRCQIGYNGYNVFDRNPELLVVAFLQADAPVHTNNWDAYITMGTGAVCGTSAAITTGDQSFFGFHVQCVAGVGSVYACTNIGGNTATETLLDISGLGLGSTPFENDNTYYAKLTSGQKIDYYINGVLLDTETANIPSGAAGIDPFDIGILKSAGTDDQIVQVKQLRFAFDQ